MGAKLLRWAIFTVLVSLSPFVIAALSLWSGDKLVNVSSLWPHGELLLLSTAFAADAIGELIPGNPNAGKARIVIVGTCVLVLIVAALWYGLIQNHPEYNAGKLSEGSILVFGFTLIVCMSAKFIE